MINKPAGNRVQGGSTALAKQLNEAHNSIVERVALSHALFSPTVIEFIKAPGCIRRTEIELRDGRRFFVETKCEEGGLFTVKEGRDD